MNYDKLEHYVSLPRLERFLTAAEGSKTKAQELYKANLQVAESFYPILHLFEIFLRNAINHRLTQHFGNSNWILKEKDGFMIHKRLKPSKFFLHSQIKNSEIRIKRRGGKITAGKVIAEQMLGFWTSLFEPHHYKLLNGTIIHCFPNRPAEIQRKEIWITLDRIREFRNRVYHNEPVCFGATEIDFTAARQIKSDVYNMLRWIDADIAEYLKQFDQIDERIMYAISL